MVIVLVLQVENWDLSFWNSQFGISVRTGSGHADKALFCNQVKQETEMRSQGRLDVRALPARRRAIPVAHQPLAHSQLAENFLRSR